MQNKDRQRACPIVSRLQINSDNRNKMYEGCRLYSNSCLQAGAGL